MNECPRITHPKLKALRPLIAQSSPPFPQKLNNFSPFVRSEKLKSIPSLKSEDKENWHYIVRSGISTNSLRKIIPNLHSFFLWKVFSFVLDFSLNSQVFNYRFIVHLYFHEITCFDHTFLVWDLQDFCRLWKRDVLVF